MSDPKPKVNDVFLIAAVLQSDPIVTVLQRELKQANVPLNAEQIRGLLRSVVLDKRVLDDTKLKQAQEELIQAKSELFTNAQRNRRSTGTFKAVPSKDAEEEVQDMWHDKTMASGGG